MRALLPLFLLVACGDDSSSDSDGKTEAAATPVVSIVSPEEGAVYVEGDSVHLEVAATLDGKSVEVTHAEWSAGDWARTGTSLDVSDLPAGELTLSVDTLVDGNTSSQSVHITVEEKPVDTGPVGYVNGVFQANVQVSGDFDVSGPCNGVVNLTGDPVANSIEGTGTCTWVTDWGDLDMLFMIDGVADSGALSGNLTLEYEGESYPTPYTGTGNVGSALSASFDETYNVSGSSLRIAGTWSADPS